MKKIRVIMSILIAMLLVGCSGAEKNKAVQIEKIVEAKSVDISDIQEGLPSYSSLKDVDFYEDALIVYASESRGAFLLAREVSAFIKKNHGYDSEIIKDTELRNIQAMGKNIFIIGNTENNKVMQMLKEKIPVSADGEKIIVGTKEYIGKNLGVVYKYPNLFDHSKAMVFVMGNSDTSLKFYDFSEYDIAVVSGLEQILPFNFREIAFADFSENWDIENIEEVPASELQTGENDKIEIEGIDYTKFPKWARGKVIYEIFVRSFYDSDGDKTGDINGITERLDYLKDIGVDVLWLMPIFDSPSYHGYNTSNYFKVNPEYGTNEDFSNLVQEVHKRGMKIIVDAAFNHCSKKEEHFVDAYNNPDSKYDKWFYFSNMQNNIYHSWNFRHDPKDRDKTNASLVAWNINNPEVFDYHMEIAKYWMDPNGDGDRIDGIDGFRLDYVKGPDHRYWKNFRREIKKMNPEFLLLGEAWVDTPELVPYFEAEMDSVFDFSLQGVMSSKVVREIREVLKDQEEFLPEHAVMARFISNHDMTRLPSNMEQEEMKLYMTLVYTLKGMPTLYYGDEIGQKGEREFGDKDLRKPMEWYSDNIGTGQTSWTSPYNEKPDGISVEEQLGVEGSLLEHIKELAKMRKENIDLIENGEMKILKAHKGVNGQERTAGKTMAYVIEDDKDKIMVILNLWKNQEEVSIDFGKELLGKTFTSALDRTWRLSIKAETMDMILKGYGVYVFKMD